VRNFLALAVNHGALVVPRAEHRLNRHLQLLVGVVGEDFAEVAHDLLELADQLAQRVGGHIGILRDAEPLFEGVKARLEVPLRDVHHHIAEHHHEAAVGVVHEARVIGQAYHPLGSGVVETEVQNRVHHAGHRELRA
jgi:hypothetical protein